MTVKETYIGDGVYVSFDGYQICLRTPRDMDQHYIYLEPIVFNELLAYAKTVFSQSPSPMSHLMGPGGDAGGR